MELVDPVLVVSDPTLTDGLPADRNVELVTPCEPGRAPWAAQLEADRCAFQGGGVAGPPPLDGALNRYPATLRRWCSPRVPPACPRPRGSPRVRSRRWPPSISAPSPTGGGGGGPMFVSTQFAHVGLMTKLPWYLRTGTRLHLVNRWRADDVSELVARERMGVIGAVAPQVALMLRSAQMDALDLSAVNLLIVGGAASPTPW